MAGRCVCVANVVCYSFDWTRKASGERVQLNEVAVYTVIDGKISREEFLYAAP